jgi:hypothetical protein
MNTPLPLHRLESAVADRGPSAYVLTVSDVGTPHVVQAEIVRDGDRLTVAVGAHTADNARRQPGVSLLYPARTPEDYSLIVNATATVEAAASGPRLRLEVTRAVLHRSTPPPDPAATSCGSDCVPLSIGGLGSGRLV